jgi:hypothetical protein
MIINLLKIYILNNKIISNKKKLLCKIINLKSIKKKDSKFLDFISIITGEYNFKEDDINYRSRTY